MKRGASQERVTGAPRKGGSRPFLREAPFLHESSGSVMLYILLAIVLLAALTFFFTRDSRDNIGTQVANRNAQELYVQSNLIRSAITECTLTHPEGAGDIAGSGTPTSADGVIDANDNPNNPYPLNPYRAATTYDATKFTPATFSPALASAADNTVRNLSCLIPPVPPAAAATQQPIFQGAGAQGRFLPQPPNGWPEWKYMNDATGVSISITPPGDATSQAAASLLAAKFDVAHAQACWLGGVFTVWILKVTSPASCP